MGTRSPVRGLSLAEPAARVQGTSRWRTVRRGSSMYRTSIAGGFFRRIEGLPQATAAVADEPDGTRSSLAALPIVAVK